MLQLGGGGRNLIAERYENMRLWQTPSTIGKIVRIDCNFDSVGQTRDGIEGATYFKKLFHYQETKNACENLNVK